MGFVLLVLIMGMLSGIIVTATNMYYNAVDLRRAEEALQSAIYSNSVVSALTPEPAAVTLKPVADMPGAKTPVDLSAHLYKLSSSTVLEGEQAAAMDVNVYFFQPETAGGK